jgi:hypothetical protein
MTEQMLKTFLTQWFNAHAAGHSVPPNEKPFVVMVAFDLDKLVDDLEKFIAQDRPYR